MQDSKVFKVLNKTSSFAFLLLSLFPILKSNLSSILLIFVLVSSAILYHKEGIERFKNIPLKYVLLYAGTYLSLVISLLYSENIKEGLDRLVQFIPLFAVPIVLIYFTPKHLEKIIPLFLSMFLLVNLVYGGILMEYLVSNYIKDSENKGFAEIIKILYNSNFNTAFWHSEQVASSDILIHKAYMSMSFLMCFCISVSRMLETNVKKIRFWIYLFLVVSFFLAIIYLLSIPNVLALIICVFLILTFYVLKIGKKRIILMVILLSFLSGLSFYYITIKEADNKDIKRGINFIKSAITFSDIEYNDPRLELYKSSWPIIKSSPIFGVGLGDTQDKLIEIHKKRLASSQVISKNELKLGEEFDQDIWFKKNVTIVQNVIMAPDKSLTAEKIIDDEVNSGHNISQFFDFGDEQEYSFSVYAKKNDCNYLILRLGDISDQRVSFDLENGTIEYRGKLIKEAKITDEGDDWYRCYITTEVRGEGLVLLGTTVESKTYNYSGQGKSLAIWGAQLERGKITPYKKNATELLQYAIDEDLNTHNNYLYFYMSGGLLCVFLFVSGLVCLALRSIRIKSFLPLAFIIILMINLLSENMLSRHFGLMFYSILFIVFFLEYFIKLSSKNEFIQTKTDH